MSCGVMLVFSLVCLLAGDGGSGDGRMCRCESMLSAVGGCLVS